MLFTNTVFPEFGASLAFAEEQALLAEEVVEEQPEEQQRITVPSVEEETSGDETDEGDQGDDELPWSDNNVLPEEQSAEEANEPVVATGDPWLSGWGVSWSHTGDDVLWADTNTWGTSAGWDDAAETEGSEINATEEQLPDGEQEGFFVEKNSRVREYIVEEGDGLTTIREKAALFLDLNDDLMQKTMLTDLEGNIFDELVRVVPWQHLLFVEDITALEDYKKSLRETNDPIDTSSWSTTNMLIPDTTLEVDKSWRFVVESVRGVDIPTTNYSYCSLMTRENLQRLLGAIWGEHTIYRGDAITLITEWRANDTLLPFAAVDEVVTYLETTAHAVFDMYLFTPVSSDDALDADEVGNDITLYKAYLNQGHRVVLFLGDDGEWYVLDTLRGEKSIYPQLLSAYLDAAMETDTTVYLRTPWYGNVTTEQEGIIVKNAAQLATYAQQNLCRI